LRISSHQLNEAESHLDNAWALFDQLGDRVRRAQVDDTVARLHLASGRFSLADEAATRAVATFEGGDEEALLAEALTTKGMVYARLKRYVEAKRLFELAHSVALRCGDREGSGRSLLIMMEEMATELTSDERMNAGERLVGLLQNCEQPTVQQRVKTALDLIKNLS
jgi:tetratricopeptide (TPR) repeat protein